MFTEPVDLPAGHYFFVPQVRLRGVGGNLLWLSAPPPQFTGDLQMWIRNADLDPDWLRVGADIVGGTTFNGSFSLSGDTIPSVTHVVTAGEAYNPSGPSLRRT